MFLQFSQKFKSQTCSCCERVKVNLEFAMNVQMLALQWFIGLLFHMTQPTSGSITNHL